MDERSDLDSEHVDLLPILHRIAFSALLFFSNEEKLKYISLRKSIYTVNMPCSVQ